MGRPGLRHVLEEHPIVVGGAHPVPTARGYSSMPPFHAMLACFSRRRYGPPYPRLRSWHDSPLRGALPPLALMRCQLAMRCLSHVQRRVDSCIAGLSLGSSVLAPLCALWCHVVLEKTRPCL